MVRDDEADLDPNGPEDPQNNSDAAEEADERTMFDTELLARLKEEYDEEYDPHEEEYGEVLDEEDDEECVVDGEQTGEIFIAEQNTPVLNVKKLYCAATFSVSSMT